MKKTCLLAVAAGMACCSIALAKPPMEQVRPSVTIEPISIARVVMVNGKMVLAGDWMPYTGGFGTRSAQLDMPAFDSYGREPGTAPTGSVGTRCPTTCALPSGQTVDGGIRWYFGSAYQNPNTIEDMQDCACPPDSVISEINLGWYWKPPAAEPCIIVYFPFEEVLAFDGTACTDPASFTVTAGGGGVALNYGTLPPTGGGYYYSRPSGIEGIGITFPGTDDNGDANLYPDGSYQMIIARSVTSSGITLATGPTQPMLWGTAQSTGDPRPGLNNEDSYDDDGPTDGILDPAECYSYAFGLCPDPIGKMNAFCYLRCPADFNNDGFVDGIDSDQFNNTFEGAGPLPQYWADLNGDCFVDGIDSDYFSNEFESACP